MPFRLCLVLVATLAVSAIEADANAWRNWGVRTKMNTLRQKLAKTHTAKWFHSLPLGKKITVLAGAWVVINAAVAGVVASKLVARHEANIRSLKEIQAKVAVLKETFAHPLSELRETHQANVRRLSDVENGLSDIENSLTVLGQTLAHNPLTVEIDQQTAEPSLPQLAE
jgi:hypothetical protein